MRSGSRETNQMPPPVFERQSVQADLEIEIEEKVKDYTNYECCTNIINRPSIRAQAQSERCPSFSSSNDAIPPMAFQLQKEAKEVPRRPLASILLKEFQERIPSYIFFIKGQDNEDSLELEVDEGEEDAEDSSHFLEKFLNRTKVAEHTKLRPVEALSSPVEPRQPNTTDVSCSSSSSCSSWSSWTSSSCNINQQRMPTKIHRPRHNTRASMMA